MDLKGSMGCLKETLEWLKMKARGRPKWQGAQSSCGDEGSFGCSGEVFRAWDADAEGVSGSFDVGSFGGGPKVRRRICFGRRWLRRSL